MTSGVMMQLDLDNRGDDASSAYRLANSDWLPTVVAQKRIELPNDPAAGTLARDILRRELDGALTGDEHGVVALLVSELVNNAVVHGGASVAGKLVLHIGVAPEQIRVEVRDAGLGFRRLDPQRPAPEDTHGWGLVMVDNVSSRWGVATGDGTCVWFELDRDAEQG